jgi:hypothetical protein
MNIHPIHHHPLRELGAIVSQYSITFERNSTLAPPFPQTMEELGTENQNSKKITDI